MDQSLLNLPLQNLFLLEQVHLDLLFLRISILYTLLVDILLPDPPPLDLFLLDRLLLVLSLLEIELKATMIDGRLNSCYSTLMSPSTHPFWP